MDALSRNHPVALIEADDIDAKLRITQTRDSEIVAIHSNSESAECEPFELHGGLVYRRGSTDKLLLYVPHKMEENVIRPTHESIAHCGIAKCVDQLALRYWLPSMKRKVERFVRNCLKCIMYSGPVRANDQTLHSIPKAFVPFDNIHIDHLGPLDPVKSKRKHVLVIVDGFTKFVMLYPVIATGTRELLASLDRYFEYYARPRRIVSDRGSCFTSAEFGGFVSELNIQHTLLATASPQPNGQMERVNRVLTGMLAKITEPIQHSDCIVLRDLRLVYYCTEFASGALTWIGWANIWTSSWKRQAREI